MDVSSPFPVGTLVKVRLTKENKSFEAQAVVASSMAGMGMGLKFTTVESVQSRILEKWISQLSGDLPYEFAAFEHEDEASAEGSLKDEQKYILNEIIIALMRKGILAKEQGKEMLRRLIL